MENTLATQLVLAFFTTNVLQMLKMSPLFPLMQKDAVWLNRVFSAFMAFLISLGIHVAHTWAVGIGGAHVLTLTIAIPAWTDVIEHLMDWLQQYGLQEMTFHGLIKKQN